MATRVEAPKELVVAALEQAIALRSRGINAATNAIIKGALEEERRVLDAAKNSLSETK